MGQILSISVNNEVKNAACQAVALVEKRRGLPVVKSASYINASTIGKLAEKNDLKITCTYDGIINESVDIPPVNNNKSRIFLLKNKMKEHLKKELEYSFAYFENPGKAEPPNINYTVYAAPVYVLKDEVKIPLKYSSAVQSFTFDFFAVTGVSNAVDPVNTIFHVYADKDRIIMVLSTGTKVEYYRANNVPPSVTTLEGITSFYYENINLTYLYVRQNFSGVKMKVILSGKLHGDAALHESLNTFIDQPIINVAAKNIVAGANDKLFNEFMLPIGHVLLRGKLDFSSDAQMGERLFLKVVSVLNILLILGLAGTSFYTFQRYGAYKNTQSQLARSSQRFLEQELDLVSKIGNTNLLSNRATYLKLLENQKNTPIMLMAPSQEIMHFYLFEKVEFSGIGADAKVIFTGERKQDNYTDLEVFKAQIQNEVNQAAAKYVKVDTEDSKFSLQELLSKMKVTIQAGDYQEKIKERNSERDNVAIEPDNVTIPENPEDNSTVATPGEGAADNGTPSGAVPEAARQYRQTPSQAGLTDRGTAQ